MQISNYAEMREKWEITGVITFDCHWKSYGELGQARKILHFVIAKM